MKFQRHFVFLWLIGTAVIFIFVSSIFIINNNFNTVNKAAVATFPNVRKDNSLVGAWYFSGYHDLTFPAPKSDQFPCGIPMTTQQLWSDTDNALPRELDYVYSTSQETDSIISAYGYVKSGTSIYFENNPTANTFEIYRLGGPLGHFYTTNVAEKDAKIKNEKYTLDGVAGNIFKTKINNTVELKRVKVMNSFFILTTDQTRINNLLTYQFSTPADVVSLGYVYPSAQPTSTQFFEIYKPLPGHNLPRKPATGLKSEMDTNVMSSYINSAAANGVDFFAFDWYWGPRSGCTNEAYLTEALENSFMTNPNVGKMKFAVAWFTFPPIYNYDYNQSTIREGFDYILNKYISHKSYLKIDGKPVVYIAPGQLVNAYGGNVNLMKADFEYANQQARAKGFPGIYWTWIEGDLDDASAKALNFDAVTAYGYPTEVPGFGDGTNQKMGNTLSYNSALTYYNQSWNTRKSRFASVLPGASYFPPVLAGWDGTLRTYIGYRGTIMTDNTPSAFGQHLTNAKVFQSTCANCKQKVIMIQAWNEWNEGSVIQPDSLFGTQMLEQVKNVYGSNYGQVGGRVVDINNNGVANYSLKVFDFSNSEITQTVTTDKNGYWTLDNLVRYQDYYAVTPNSAANPSSYQGQMAGVNDCGLSCDFKLTSGNLNTPTPVPPTNTPGPTATLTPATKTPTPVSPTPTIVPTTVTIQKGDVHRLRKNGAYFFSWDTAEINSFISKGWVDDGVAFAVAKTQGTNMRAIYRYRNSTSTIYFYSFERDEIKKDGDYGFYFDKIAWYAYPQTSNPAGLTPIYRLSNKTTGVKIYTQSAAERDAIVKSYGYVYEGVAFYI